MKPNPIILLLTGSINVANNAHTKNLDINTRKKEYEEAIKYYLANYDYPIVFVENSGEDISELFRKEIANKQLEILVFNQNTFGKGIGDMNCIEYAINNSAFILDNTFILKITGRYKVLNLNKYLQEIEKNNKMEVYCDLHKKAVYSTCYIFGLTKKFATNFLFKNKMLIDDNNPRRFFEHILAMSVLEAMKKGMNVEVFKVFPKVDAIAGTYGKKYKTSFFYLFPRNVRFYLRYLIHYRK